MPKLIDLQTTIDHRAARLFFNVFQKPIDRLLALDRLNSAYALLHQRLAEAPQQASVFDTVLDILGIQYETNTPILERIPDRGPLLVVSNHPFGAIEGIIVGSLLMKARTDVRILGNYLLKRIAGIQDHIIAVDPFESHGVTRKSLKGLKQCLGWLKQGNVLATFPAGEVASYRLAKWRVVEPTWTSHIGALARMTKATILPLYFPGRNSNLFMLMGLLHPRLRTLMLVRELMNKTGKCLRLYMGKPIPWQCLGRYATDKAVTDYLRLKTEVLKIRDVAHRRVSETIISRFNGRKRLQPLIDPVASTLLRKDIGQLPKDQKLLTRGDFSVYIAHSAQIPYLMNEIGRLRELSYRDVQEGTGRPLDLDQYDAYYLHLFLWNHRTSELIGAYRMGLVDQIIGEKGIKGLYTNALFHFAPAFVDHLQGAIEFGRSFVRPEYQRKFNGLMLIWRGIGEFIRRNQHYRILFGPVSISSDYHAVSKTLLIKFLIDKKINSNLSSYVTPRRPFRPEWNSRLSDALSQAMIRGVDDISLLISEIENDGKGIPVLLKHYLKLNGQLLSFNIDKAFSNVVDGLLHVDLRQTDPKILHRFMGTKDLSGLFAKEIPSAYKLIDFEKIAELGQQKSKKTHQ
jgi:putative hemolysin